MDYVEIFPIMSTIEYDRRRGKDRNLPVTPSSIPWCVIGPHRKQALNNHSQTLERLRQRGGLSPSEAVAVLEDREWAHIPTEVAVARLAELVKCA